MSNILIITAHPSSRNLTKGMADIYKNEKEAQGHDVTLVDLYKDKQLEYHHFEDAHNPPPLTEAQEYYQGLIKDASEIVFIYPFWWGTMPAILKNWLDATLYTGFAFTYEDNGRPVGLLQGRRVRVLSTCGAPKFLYVLNGINRANVNMWKKSIIRFCGMDYDGFHLFGGVDTSGKNTEKIFAAVKKLANS